MTARKGWVFDDPPPPREWPEFDSSWGVTITGHTGPHLHGRCPECGYATRYKQFGPMRCACSPGAVVSPEAEMIRTRHHD